MSRRFKKYYNQASLLKLNKDREEDKLTQMQLTDIVLKTERADNSVAAQFPKLIKELNESASKIPAYIRFQKENECVLRDDIKNIKQEAFKSQYNKQLSSPKDWMQQVEFSNKKLNGTGFYEMKYFLTST